MQRTNYSDSHAVTVHSNGLQLAEVQQQKNGLWYAVNSGKPGFKSLELAEASELVEWLRFYLESKKFDEAVEIHDYLYGAIVPQRGEAVA